MKKQSVSSKTIGATNNVVVVHSKRHRLFGILGLVALFLCGLLVGTTMHGKRVVNNVQQQPVVSENKDVPACEVIENALKMDIMPDGMIDYNYLNHNVDVYTKLVQYGCPENREKYESMVRREQQIANAFREETSDNMRNCERIERLLKDTLRNSYSTDSYSHIDNAKVYANLSERGCPEHSDEYKKLAEQELQIARALEDDRMTENETMQIVETYKRIQMRQQAQQVLDTVKKLTNPAIDFIIEVEKIINE